MAKLADVGTSVDVDVVVDGNGDVDVLGSVTLVDPETGQKLLTLRGRDRDVGLGFSLNGKRLAFSADGRWLVTGGAHGSVKAWRS